MLGRYPKIMLSICVIADTHKLHRSIVIPECDILIHCGDMCSFGGADLAVLEDIDAWFGEVPARRVICIGGNHDYPLESKLFNFTNAAYLEDSEVTIEGLKFYGSPWCPDLQGFAFYGSDMTLHHKWSSIPSDVDILITHTPPSGVLDRPSSGLVSLGCPMLREQLERILPKYHLFGHVHASSGSICIEGVNFINAAIVGGKDFQVKSEPHLIQLPLVVLSHQGIWWVTLDVMSYREYIQLFAEELAHELTPNARIKKFTKNSAVIGAYAESTVNSFVQKMVSPLNVSTGAVISPELY